MSQTPRFDQYANSYDEDLNQALAVTGAGKDFFALGRLSWLARCLGGLGEAPRTAMDYGCGIGSTVPLFFATFPLTQMVGVDVSAKSLETAREKYSGGPVVYSTIAEYEPQGCLDLVYTNGVFHHIPKAERPAALAYVRDSLRSGGYFAFWENNPWSPATRYVMSRCTFDRDAQALSILQATKLFRAAGFSILRYDFLFIFPNFLKALRPLEPLVSKLVLGAQYLLLARKT